MKVLFANPAYRIDVGNNYERYFFCAGSRCPWSLIKRTDELPRYSMFPFFMAYAAALLERDGHRVEALDAVPLNMREDTFIRESVEAAPDIIVFEPATTSFNYVLGISRALKERTGARIIFTGPHATVYPDNTLENNTHVDFIVLGEYELALQSLINRLRDERGLEGVDGLAYRGTNGAVVIQPKTVYSDLEALPMPARHLFPSKKCNDLAYYHDGFCQNRPAVQMHSSRGCPYTCSFCLLPQVMYKRGLYRTFSTRRIIAEMKQVIENHRPGEIYFDDDSFTVNKTQVMELCTAIREHGIRIPWSVMGDAMNTDEAMLWAMKKAGCIGIKFGLESANRDILKTMGKPVKLERLEQLVKLCNRLLIKCHISISFGHMGETAETIRETVRYVTKLSVDSIQFSLATPYPGTALYKHVDDESLLIAKDWTDFDPTHNPIVSLPTVDTEYLKHIEQIAHGYWLRRKLMKPGWVVRQLYFIIYILRRQGLAGFINRIKRGVDLIFSHRFK